MGLFFKEDNSDVVSNLTKILGFIQGKTNSVGDLKNTNGNPEVLALINEIGTLLQQKYKEELTVYGEIMLVSEKLADGLTDDRVTKSCPNQKLNYIAKTVNTMAQKLDLSLTEVDKVLQEYSEHNFMKKVTEGTFNSGKLCNLPIRINELGTFMTESLQNIKKSNDVLQVEASELHENVTDLVSISTEQSYELSKVAEYIKNISTQLNEIKQSLQTMTSFGSEVEKSIEVGLKFANDTVTAMNEINDSTNAVNEAITIIDQIAFQTNILSLNAAVEAATAGEAGKGFAVVAAEVRNLASRSADAAKEIKALVGNATTQAHEGKNIADKMIEGYMSLSKNSEQTFSIIKNIADLSKEQENSFYQIESLVSNIETKNRKTKTISDSLSGISQAMSNASEDNLSILKGAKFRGV